MCSEKGNVFDLQYKKISYSVQVVMSLTKKGILSQNGYLSYITAINMEGFCGITYQKDKMEEKKVLWKFSKLD